MKRRPHGNRIEQDTIDWKTILRLLRKTERVGDCLEWQGYCDRQGYGQAWFAGRAHWVHRIMYAALVGTVPSGMDVHHTCGNKSCCKPGHLDLVEHVEHGKGHGFQPADGLYYPRRYTGNES